MGGAKGRSGGQNRKSRALHVVQGTFRADRHAAEAPDPPAGAPTAPGVLSGEAAAEWDRMIARLSTAKVLSTVDGPLLWNYCHVWADACRLQASADALTSTWYEKVTVDGAGAEHREPRVHPVFAQLKQYRLALRVLLVEFGLTPLSRNRVKALGETVPAVDPRKARYLSGLAKK